MAGFLDTRVDKLDFLLGGWASIITIALVGVITQALGFNVFFQAAFGIGAAAFALFLIECMELKTKEAKGE